MSARRYSATRAALRAAELRGAQRALSIADSFRVTRESRLRERRAARVVNTNAHRDQRSRDEMVRLSEDLARNNVVASAFVERRGELVAGPSPSLRLRSDSDDWNGEAAEFLDEWFRGGFDHEGVLTFGQFAAFAVENNMQSGDGLLVMTEAGACQWVDGYRIRNPHNRQDTDTLVGGVRLTGDGRVAGYEVAQWNSRGDQLTTETEFVDAADCIYVGNPRMARAGQRRAVPTLATLADRLTDLDRLHEAVTKSAEMAAMLSIFVKSAHPEASPLDYVRGVRGEDAAAAERARQDNEVLLRPGLVADLAEGEEIQTVTPPQPGNQYDRMLWAELQILAARVGLPLEMAFYRYTNNFSAGRSAIVSAWRSVLREQRWLQDRVLTPVVRWRLAVAIERGELPWVRNWERVQWKLPGIPTLDLGYEVDAVVRGVAGGVMLREDAVDRINDGLGIDDFFASRGLEIERENELGIATQRPSNITETTSQVTSVEAVSTDA